MAEWLPNSEAAILVKHDEFTAKIGAYQATFGLTAGQITQVTNDNAWLHRTIDSVVSFKDFANALVSFKNRVWIGDPSAEGPLIEPVPPTLPAAPAGLLEDIIGRWRALVQFLKAHPNYTPAIGQDLGIVAPVQTGALKPGLEAVSLGGGVARVTGTKDIYDGLDIYSQRANETTWTFLARDNFPPYDDNRALLVAGQPEERRYRAKFVDNDVQVGDWSDTVSVIVGA